MLVHRRMLQFVNATPDKMSHKDFCRRASAAYGAMPDKTTALCGIPYLALFILGGRNEFLN